MDIMLALSAICVMTAVLLYATRYISRKRKWILIFMELTATCLLSFDRTAYLYRGVGTAHAAFMVRLSNFMVFFLTPGIVLVFNLYLSDLLLHDCRVQTLPRRLRLVNTGAVCGMAMTVLAHFTGLYYYFDEQNIYHRGPGFLISYLVPVLFPLIQFTVICQYRKRFSKLIYISLVLYIFLPICTGIVQIFTYGLSIVNMAMVLVSVCLYIFTYLEVNAEAVRAHEREVWDLQKEQQSMKRLFDQTVMAFVTAVEKRDPYSEGHSVRVADYARRIAETAGKTAEACDEVYYAALLHDVGMIALPDAVIRKSGSFTESEQRELRQKPAFSAEILSRISEFPYLSECARCSHERYDGKGYPAGLKAEEIPEIARIVAVADACDTMLTGKHTHAPLSYLVVREEFIKQAGAQFDPAYAEIMVQIMDDDYNKERQSAETALEKELVCGAYRETVSAGIRIEETITKITFSCEADHVPENGFSAPSVIVFDSYDRHIHSDVRTIEAYRYLEFGEIWFDGHYVSTNARNMIVQVHENEKTETGYTVTACRFEDHLTIRMVSPERAVEITMALPDNSKSSYIGLTGEHCRLTKISARQTGERAKAGSIRKIVSKLSYINRLESDVPNLQIDHRRSVSTPGIPLKDELFLDFHSMSLPSANLVWHCPYLVLFTAEDKKVGGKGYREFALIKINGESSGNGKYAENTLVMKKNADFAGWDAWKERNKEGIECSVRLRKKGSRIIVSTENLGISLENTTVILGEDCPVYAALTGDQVALTDIRVR